MSLGKVTAPVEYQELGILLPQRRRKNAEEGPIHRTARKIGLLFKQIVPPIGDLIKAYGTRVAEIEGALDIDQRV